MDKDKNQEPEIVNEFFFFDEMFWREQSCADDDNQDMGSDDGPNLHEHPINFLGD